jgi:hypothetical protein
MAFVAAVGFFGLAPPLVATLVAALAHLSRGSADFGGGVGRLSHALHRPLRPRPTESAY